MRAVAILGILLDALNCRKELYMNNAPYEVGQILALADTLHKDYCTIVRNGSLPSVLIGTSLMRRAFDNPTAALADLTERIIEYLRWAKTAKKPKPDAAKTEEENKGNSIAFLEARRRCAAICLWRPNSANTIYRLVATTWRRPSFYSAFSLNRRSTRSNRRTAPRRSRKDRYR